MAELSLKLPMSIPHCRDIGVFEGQIPATTDLDSKRETMSELVLDVFTDYV